MFIWVWDVSLKCCKAWNDLILLIYGDALELCNSDRLERVCNCLVMLLNTLILNPWAVGVTSGVLVLSSVWLTLRGVRFDFDEIVSFWVFCEILISVWSDVKFVASCNWFLVYHDCCDFGLLEQGKDEFKCYSLSGL